MTGGLGFVKSGQLSLENNRKLLNRDRNFKKRSDEARHKNQLQFRQLSKGELSVLQKRYVAERKRENRRNSLLLVFLFVLVGTVFLLFIL